MIFDDHEFADQYARDFKPPGEHPATADQDVAAQDRAWGAALTLVMLTFFVTLTARIVTARFASRR